MINYVTHNQIDKKKWNECILHSFNGIVYAYSWYLDIVCPNWEALVKGDYEAVMPLTGNKKYGQHYLFQPSFTQQLGVFSHKHLTEKNVQAFILAIPKQYQFIEINLNTFNKFSLKTHKTSEFLTHELDMIQPYESIAKKFSENTKRNIKKAEKEKLHLQTNIKPQQTIDLFVKGKGKEIKAFKKKQYDMLTQLYQVFSKVGSAKSWGVTDQNNNLIAGAMFFFSNNKAIFLFSGTSAAAKQNGAMFFLINEFIKAHSERNLTLDFEGSNNPNLARFYKSFGAKPITYLHIKKNNLPFYLKWLKK